MALEQEILDKVQQIRVWKPPYTVAIDNPTVFKFLGAGKQGAVFRIDDKRCVKLYFEKESMAKELHSLHLGGKAGICPKVYVWGSNFIVMEYLNAPSLQEHLQNNPMTEALAASIVRLLDTFEAVGFNRFDHAGRHIYVLPNNKLKVIDVVHVIKEQPVWLPQKLFADIGEYSDSFLNMVKQISLKWYRRWTEHPDFTSLMDKLKHKQ